MRPSKAKDPRAAGPPSAAHRACPPAFAGTGSRRPADTGQLGQPFDAPPEQSAEPEFSAPETSDPHVIDQDVPAAVGRVLERLMEERVTRATALDPSFGHDVATRVARFTLDGGKRTRSQFTWWALRACGGGTAEAQAALSIGSALEVIQTCALVHDDVMDRSARRRGGPALHADVAAQYADRVPPAQGARFGEAVAILAGDLALAWADDIVADTVLAPGVRSRVRDLWSAMRTEMVAGQYLDLQGQATSSRSVARAIRAACLKSALYSVERPLALGAALAQADAATTRALCSAGRCVGMAFQLRDDLLDVFGDPARTGKPAGSDIRAGKPTYLAAVAQARAASAHDHRAAGVLRDSLGRADLSDTELDEVREVLVGTGARDLVEGKISRLVAQGMRHLDGAALQGHGRLRLAHLLRAAGGATPEADGPTIPTGAEEGMPASLLLAVTPEGATR
jgi:geranylgeranyl diphosphate synthase type I